MACIFVKCTAKIQDEFSALFHREFAMLAGFVKFFDICFLCNLRRPFGLHLLLLPGHSRLQPSALLGLGLASFALFHTSHHNEYTLLQLSTIQHSLVAEQ